MAFQSLLPTLRQNVLSLTRVLESHYALCSATEIHLITKSSDGAVLDSSNLVISNPIEWKQYDHCALILRLYALFESFIDELIEQWLSEIPTYFNSYADLDCEVKQQHRIGVAHLLNRFGNKQYQHLALSDIVEGLYLGAKGHDVYRLLADAFLTETRNYSWDILSGLCKNVGMADLDSTLLHEFNLTKFMSATFNDTETVTSQLNRLIDLRNKAAHDEVSQTLSLSELRDLASFVLTLCEGFVLVAEDSKIRKLIRCGHLTEHGRVIHRFQNSIVGIESTACRWRVGQKVFATFHDLFRQAEITSIQQNAKAFNAYDAVNDECLAMRLSDPISCRSKIYLTVDTEPHNDYMI